MDNNKVVTISIFDLFKHEKDAIFLFLFFIWKICLENFEDLVVCNKKCILFFKIFWIFLKYFEENQVF